VVPRAPTNLVVTNVEATQVRLRFIPGFSGHTFISLWIVEGQKNYASGNYTWIQVYSVSDPDALSIVVADLQPHATYRLRLVAVNVAGRSSPSEPTEIFHTLETSPSVPPARLVVRPHNETALLVQWAVCRHFGFVLCTKLFVLDMSDCVSSESGNTGSCGSGRWSSQSVFWLQLADFSSDFRTISG